MGNCDLREIYNAIETYYADNGVVEVYGIMNAFIRSMEQNENLFVLTETKEYEGERRYFKEKTDVTYHIDSGRYYRFICRCDCKFY